MVSSTFFLLCALLVVLTVNGVTANSGYTAWNILKEKHQADWFKTVGKKIIDNVVTYQHLGKDPKSPYPSLLPDNYGGWSKAFDAHSPRNAKSLNFGYGPEWQGRATIDNGATHSEIRLLAQAYTATKNPSWKTSCILGIEFLLNLQKPAGGFPQNADAEGYHAYITLNDDAMVEVLQLLRDVGSRSDEFQWIDQATAAKAKNGFDRGINALLAMQIKLNGKLTGWCAQYEEVSSGRYVPRGARKFELESNSGAEGYGVLQLLMSLPNPSPQVKRAIEAAHDWFESVKITGYKFDRKTGVHPSPGSTMWARFYAIKDYPSGVKVNQPLFADRDGKAYKSWDMLSRERAGGYAWYVTSAKTLEAEFSKWRSTHGE